MRTVHTWDASGLPCVVEDDDGIRMLVTDKRLIPHHVYATAIEFGAQAIICGDDFVDVDTFTEHRGETAEGYLAPETVWRKVSGGTDYRGYIDLVERSAPAAREPEFVNLHSHSEHSPMDGLSTCPEMVAAVVADGQTSLALTDHGTCSGHPALQAACDAAGIAPIFGIEAYLVDDRFARPEASNAYWHVCLWATDDESLIDLWAASTESHRDGFHYKPRLDWDTLERHGGRLLASTACLGGPVANPLIGGKVNDLNQGDPELALANLARLEALFPGRLYVELHTNRMDIQREVNGWLVAVATERELPMIAVADSHYACAEDAPAHRTWLAVNQSGDKVKTVEDVDMFSDGPHYHLHTAAQAREALSYLGEDVAAAAVAETVRLAARCTARIRPKPSTPVYSKPTEAWPNPVAHDGHRLLDLCLENWDARTKGKSRPQQAYIERFDHEFPMYVRKGFAGYVLMLAKIINFAKDSNILVGPGRGSGGGSLVLYLAGVTEMDPIEDDLLFGRFMTEGRTSLPDVDTDFPSKYKSTMLNYVSNEWGTEHTVTVGTHLRLKNKGVIKNTAGALKNSLPEDYFYDFEKVSKIVTEAEASSAGLGISWDELWTGSADELAPYYEKYPHVFEMAGRLHGRLKSYGRHAAGVVIDPDVSIEGNLPLRAGEVDKDGKPGAMITQFDMDALESQGYVKFDFLNLRTLDTIQDALDLIARDTGHRIDFRTWREEYADPEVFDAIALGWTKGIFQIETTSGTRMAKRFGPRSMAELADVITLVRPGPVNSGLTEEYLKRRAGERPVSYDDPRLESVLAKTYGLMIYQEDIMATCMVLAGYTEAEADGVRKILGKKQVEKVADAGRKFVEAAVVHGLDREIAERMWTAMAEFAKYCVSGDTRVHLASSGPSSNGTISIERLYQLINTPLEPARGRWDPPYPGPCNCCGKHAAKYVRGRCNACYVWLQKFRDVERGVSGLTLHADDRIRPARILQVHRHEPAPTWTIALDDGRSITATANHRHVTPAGPRRVDELVVGEQLVVDTGYEPHPYDPAEQRTTSVPRQLVGAVNGAPGELNYGYADGGFTRLMAWTAQAPDYCQDCGHDGSVHRLERAHLDGDRTHNEPENLRMLCVSCHKRHDYAHNGRRRRWEKGHASGVAKIVSIEPAGTQPVYSLVMDDPHLWVANGIVTENSFNRAHAMSYAYLGYWTAWLKVHYPVQMMCALLSTVDQDRIGDFVEEARRLGIQVAPPDINASGEGFTSTADGVRYGLLSIKGVGDKAVAAVRATAPYTSYEDFIERRSTKCDMGQVKLLVRVGAFDTLEPNRRGLLAYIAAKEAKSSSRCRWLSVDEPRTFDLATGGPPDEDATVTLPCSFDWASEPPPMGRPNKKGECKPQKRKPLPKKCSAACRQFDPEPPPDPSSVQPFTDGDIGQIESEMLGVRLSTSEFDRVPEHIRAQLSTASQIMVSPVDHDDHEKNYFLVASLIRRVHRKKDRYDRTMAFVSLTLESGGLDGIVMFSAKYEDYKKCLSHPGLIYVILKNTDRGLQVVQMTPAL